ncbi:MAG: hypothetical protein D6705_07800 [Deltaproteobacteria bacterium]|nr:MAG: hypothetical protein D6705_07800 [Deltaproteobacteria bacterium]
MKERPWTRSVIRWAIRCLVTSALVVSCGGDFASGLRRAERARARRPNDPDAAADLAEAYLRVGRPQAAVAEAERAFRLSGDPSHLLLRGRARVLAGDRAGGREDIVRASKVLDEPLQLVQVAATLVRLDAPEAAADAARRAAGDPRAATPVIAGCVVVLAESGHAKEAYALARRALERDDRDRDLLVAAGALAVRLRRFADARRIYERLADVAPDLETVDQALALITYELGDLAAAEAHARRAVARRGDRDPSVHYTLVVVLRARGRHAEAEAALRNARKRFPHDPDLATADRGTGSVVVPAEDRPANGIVEQPHVRPQPNPAAVGHDPVPSERRRQDTIDPRPRSSESVRNGLRIGAGHEAAKPEPERLAGAGGRPETLHLGRVAAEVSPEPTGIRASNHTVRLVAGAGRRRADPHVRP